MCDEQLRRIKQLEVALAHQESIVQDLSAQLIQQWQKIEIINGHLVKIDEKLEKQSLSQTVTQSDEPPPPHY
tara:strand:- start:221 stop:436 length:216 start_codon:yes stop_codon:yes gene_type:complete